MEFHPLADCFPLMSGDEFEDLKNDIGLRGLNHPVVTYHGSILDGRNRWRACEELGISCQTKEYGGSDPAAFVVSENIHRRHLTPSQRAMIASKLTTASHGGARYGKAVSETNDQETGRSLDVTREDAARLMSVGTTSVDRAHRVQRDGIPAVAEAVERGELELTKADRIVRQPPERQEEMMSPSGFVEPPRRGGTPVTRLRRAMERYVGFDIARDEYTPDLLQQIPVSELSDFLERLKRSRSATASLINDLREIVKEKKGTA